jgi:hypothetical protein
MNGEPGRNDPCPCGSGKKYKKCCLGQERPNELDGIARRLTIEPAARAISVEFPDGTTVTEPWISSAETDGSEISRLSFDVAQRELDLILPGDQMVTVEVGSAGADLPPPGVPVVYLDQLHWIALAQHEWAPEKLKDEDQRTAASTLIELAREKRIILPLSAAHMTETVPNNGRRRRHLAGTMLELSRGWVMRNPVRVRHEEISAALNGREPRATGVFTLRPWEIFTEDIRPSRTPEHAMPGWDEIYPRLTAVSAIYSTLISDEKIDLTDGWLRADAWAALHQELSEFLREDGASRERVELAARGRLLDDLKMEIAHAAQQSGIDPAAFTAWLQDGYQDAVAAMPYLGRLEQILIHRLRDANDKWERNDLNDMNYLACAGGYADVVVGEKKTSDYLARADRALTPHAFVCAKLPQAVEHLSAMPAPSGL